MKKISELLSLKKITDMQSRLQLEIDRDGQAGLPYELLHLKTLEKDGGACFQCGQEWRKVRVQNRFADFYYFIPACNCYPRCPHCLTSLHREMAIGGLPEKCPNCRLSLVDAKLAQVTDYQKNMKKR